MEAWNRTGTTGRGREILERAAEETKTTRSEEDVSLLSFLADERMSTLLTTKPFVSKRVLFLVLVS